VCAPRPASLLLNCSSYGPCQFPTVGFVVERYDAIANFVSERFWSIHLTYTAPDVAATAAAPGAPQRHPDADDDENGDGTGDENGEQVSVRGRPRFANGAGAAQQRSGRGSGGNTVTFSWTRGRLYDFLPAFVLYELAVSTGSFTVVSVNPHPSSRCVGRSCICERVRRHPGH
jgi:DNA topoisomerase-3